MQVSWRGQHQCDVGLLEGAQSWSWYQSDQTSLHNVRSARLDPRWTRSGEHQNIWSMLLQECHKDMTRSCASSVARKTSLTVASIMLTLLEPLNAELAFRSSWAQFHMLHMLLRLQDICMEALVVSLVVQSILHWTHCLLPSAIWGLEITILHCNTVPWAVPNP